MRTGAGKTTTVRMLCTLAWAAVGGAAVAGFDVADLVPGRGRRPGQSPLADWHLALSLAGSRPTAPIAGARVSQSPIVTTIDVR
jgi:hypothetical protein